MFIPAQAVLSAVEVLLSEHVRVLAREVPLEGSGLTTITTNTEIAFPSIGAPNVIPTATFIPSSDPPLSQAILPSLTSIDIAPGQNLASASLFTPAIVTATVFAFPPEPSTSSSLSPGAAAGITIFVCGVLASLLTTAFVFWTRRRSRHTVATPKLFSYRSQMDELDEKIFGRRSSLGVSQTSLPPEALRTSPYTVRKPPPRYTLVGKASTPQAPSPTSTSDEKSPIAYPDVVYIQGTRVSESSLPNPHSQVQVPQQLPDLDVISISKQNGQLNDVDVKGLPAPPDLVLKHPGYLSPISGSVRVGRLLRTFTQRTQASERSTRTRGHGPEGTNSNADHTVIGSGDSEVATISAPPQYVSSLHGGLSSPSVDHNGWKAL
ncbi:hypothetical protein BC629DRAFT_1637189 [Irpex lacteus]|nr:hypothetical protein BC629DRAFT_1637189 [Irpex lacteus]